MDSANIARSHSAFSVHPPPLPFLFLPPSALPLMVMALMTEETKRRHGGGTRERREIGDGEIWEGKRGSGKEEMERREMPGSGSGGEERGRRGEEEAGREGGEK